MRKLWACDKCGESFNDERECIDHEHDCQKTQVFVCYQCGVTINYQNNDIVAKETMHNISLGRMGYGSKLDGCDVNFDLCDDCLYNLVDSLKLKKEIFDSGVWII